MLKIVLGICGLAAMVIATQILLSPASFYAANHINLHHNVNLLSEIRTPATALFTYGLLILSGIVLPRLTFTSTLLSTALYLSYGLGRLVGMQIDGLPVQSLMVATGIELTFGLLSLICLVKLLVSSDYSLKVN